MVVPFAIIGVVLGVITAEVFMDRKSTIFSHSGHIFISTMASLIYLIAFGFLGWMEDLFISFIIVVLAVVIPCCFSDIVFPLMFVDKKAGEMVSSCSNTCEHPSHEKKQRKRTKHNH